jgi:hypothetical protein
MSCDADFSPESTVNEDITFKHIVTFFEFSFETDSPAAERAKRDGGGTITSERSSRVRFRFRPLYQFLICSRIALTIARASR